MTACKKSPTQQHVPEDFPDLLDWCRRCRYCGADLGDVTEAEGNAWVVRNLFGGKV